MIISKRKSDIFFDYAMLAFLTLTGLLCLAPILNTFALSFSDQSKAAAGLVYFLPVGFSTQSYNKIIADTKFLTSFIVSIERVFLGGGLNVLLTIFMAYPLSKDIKAFRARNVYMWMIIFTMLFSGGLIPWYMTIKAAGLLDKIWALVLPGAVPVFYIIIMMNFFKGVPKELEEAAVMDGAGPWYILLRIYLPVSLPSIATITLFSVVGHWNSFFDGLILMNHPQNYPLQTYIQSLSFVLDIRSITNQEELRRMLQVSNQTMNAAKIVVSMVPIILVYPFLQRYFISGIVLGAVKE